jgi:hypothetical protein
MTREEFIDVLNQNGLSYRTEGETIVVDHEGNVSLGGLTSLNPGVEFRNGGFVSLDSLTSLNPGVEFRNSGNVWLDSLTSLNPGVEFRNGDNVSLDSLTSLNPGVEFRNSGNVWLDSLNRLPLEDYDSSFGNGEKIWIGKKNIGDGEFLESRWIEAKKRRVKTFESFTYDI